MTHLQENSTDKIFELFNKSADAMWHRLDVYSLKKVLFGSQEGYIKAPHFDPFPVDCLLIEYQPPAIWRYYLAVKHFSNVDTLHLETLEDILLASSVFSIADLLLAKNYINSDGENILEFLMNKINTNEASSDFEKKMFEHIIDWLSNNMQAYEFNKIFADVKLQEFAMKHFYNQYENGRHDWLISKTGAKTKFIEGVRDDYEYFIQSTNECVQSSDSKNFASVYVGIEGLKSDDQSYVSSLLSNQNSRACFQNSSSMITNQIISVNLTSLIDEKQDLKLHVLSHSICHSPSLMERLESKLVVGGVLVLTGVTLLSTYFLYQWINLINVKNLLVPIQQDQFGLIGKEGLVSRDVGANAHIFRSDMAPGSSPFGVAASDAQHNATFIEELSSEVEAELDFRASDDIALN